MDVNLWEPTGLQGLVLTSARDLGVGPSDIYRMGENRAKQYMIKKGISNVFTRMIWNALKAYIETQPSQTQPSPPEDEIVSLKKRVSTLENEIVALKRQVQELQDQRAPQTRSSSSSSSSVVSVSTPTAAGRTPETFFIWNRSAIDEHLKNITPIIDKIPALRSWRRIQDVRKASLIFILAFAPGGRADITWVEEDPSLFQGAKVVGISLATGFENPVKFPEKFTTQFNLFLDDSFLAIRSNDHNKNELDALQKLDPNALMRMNSECAFCLEMGPMNQCANQCGALYCDQECANADWTKGHGADCEKIGGLAPTKGAANIDDDELRVKWRLAAPFLKGAQLERIIADGWNPEDWNGNLGAWAQNYGFQFTEAQANKFREWNERFRR